MIGSAESYYLPTLLALRNLGGQATPKEVYSEIVNDLNLVDEDIAETTSGGESLYKNRVRFARLILLKAGLLNDESLRGIWQLSDLGVSIDIASLNARKIKQVVYENGKFQVGPKNPVQKFKVLHQEESSEGEDTREEWERHLLQILTIRDENDQQYNRSLDDRFEKIVASLLRKMEVDIDQTIASRDGGLDGIGTYSIGGILTEKVAFQAKRYGLKNKVGRPDIQSFVGALTSENITRGIFVTTSTFSAEAIEDARKRNNTVQLIDGEMLIQLLRRYKLGVTTQEVIVEKINIDDEFFTQTQHAKHHT
ncbi:restriction endonuclease [Leuconostoc gelidum subsp. gelidum]|uniref:restriction endonuclease n=1 Tax=Leuconostoc gelidum TaxID=1244 RepID=UPI001CC3F1BE|nr:restriction endonuclease [Leuconostoc gelidum]MBZ6014246.1 restriction endonuclease [Leuconostoc gelidum subsp. gelidum]